MTSTVNADTAPAPAGRPGGPDQQGELIYIDPHEVVIEENIRTVVDVGPDDEFVASIRDRGVHAALEGYWGEDGTVVIRDGQRRITGARLIGPPGTLNVPVLVRASDTGTQARILEQLDANEQRKNLTDADRAAAWAQLKMDGMSVTAIVREAKADKDRVKVGLAVASNAAAMAAVREHQLTLEQAATLAKFELADDPDALTALRETALSNPTQFDHVAQRLADEREQRAKLQAVRDRYEAQGVTVVDWPRYNDDTTVFLNQLQTADGQPLTQGGYAGKPGYAIAIRASHYRHDDDEDGVQVEPVVVNWQAHGLRKADSSGAVKGPRTDQEKAERKRVIANNKAWRSAEKVREEWLRAFLARKLLPADALAFAAVTLAANGHEITRAVSDGHRTAKTLLGLEPSFDAAALTTLAARRAAKTSSKTANVIMAITLGALEAATDVSTWRTPNDTDIRYFQQLAAWGYTLSEVESLVLAAGGQDATGQDPGSAETPRADHGDTRPAAQEPDASAAAVTAQGQATSGDGGDAADPDAPEDTGTPDTSGERAAGASPDLHAA